MAGARRRELRRPGPRFCSKSSKKSLENGLLGGRAEAGRVEGVLRGVSRQWPGAQREEVRARRWAGGVCG